MSCSYFRSDPLAPSLRPTVYSLCPTASDLFVAKNRVSRQKAPTSCVRLPTSNIEYPTPNRPQPAKTSRHRPILPRLRTKPPGLWKKLKPLYRTFRWIAARDFPSALVARAAHTPQFCPRDCVFTRQPAARRRYDGVASLLRQSAS
jgi:hypothetical protein